MKRDGTGEKILTSGLCDDPVVSPAGNYVVYTKWENGFHRLYKVPKGGGAQTALTGPGYNCASPQFSQDGMKVAYEKFVNGFSNIYTYTLSTAQEQEIAGGDCHYFNPRFSPDGKWIACEKVYSDGKSQICKVPTDSGGLVVLTSDDNDYEYPTFTPDSDWVICVKWFTDGTAICKVPVNGGNAIILTDTSSIKLFPEVSPNGNWVAYEALAEDGDGEEVNSIGILYLPSVGVSDEENFGVKPKVFVLYQNRPNPFRNGTRIKYGLPKTAKVRLMVYNITGRAVKKLVEEEQKEGYYDIVWNGRDNRGKKLPSGVYFYRLETEQTNLIKKIIMTK
jgi:Tol biopolymer transport system component